MYSYLIILVLLINKTNANLKENGNHCTEWGISKWVLCSQSVSIEEGKQNTSIWFLNECFYQILLKKPRFNWFFYGLFLYCSIHLGARVKGMYWRPQACLILPHSACACLKSRKCKYLFWIIFPLSCRALCSYSAVLD